MIGWVAANGMAAETPSKPIYPPSYVELNRIGEVLARCDLSKDFHRSNCHILATEGGNAFAASVLKWFAHANSKVEATPQRVDERTRDYFVRFVPSGYRGVSFGPVSWRTPLPIPHRSVLIRSPTADCAIKPGGLPTDCRIPDLASDDPDAVAELEWLRDANVHFQEWPDLNGGARRIVSLMPDADEK